MKRTLIQLRVRCFPRAPPTTPELIIRCLFCVDSVAIPKIAIVPPAWVRSSANSGNHFQIRVGHHQPLGSLVRKVDLHAGVSALALEIQHHPLAEF